VQRDDVEAIAPLSPMQRGMLFHALYQPHADAYITQFDLELRGDVDAHALDQAWQWLIARHGVLRTSFHWESLDAPLQVVQKRIKSPLIVHDWSERDASASARVGAVQPDGGRPASRASQGAASALHVEAPRIERFRAGERARRFDLSRAPAARLALLRGSDGRAHLILTNHHIILDGWSTGLLAKELFEAYDAFASGRQPALTPIPAFRHYIAWLHKQDREAATRFWRDRLGDFEQPTHLGLERAHVIAVDADDAETHGRLRVELSREESARVQAFAQRHALTLNAVLEGAWALLLSRYSRNRDVVFGTVTSGRPAELPSVESMVGLFINTLPLRVTIDPQESAIELLQRVQRTGAAMRGFEYLPLAEVQRLSAAAPGTPLFDTLFVFENYPLERSLDRLSSALRIERVEVHERTNYPLTIASGPGECLLFDATYDRAAYDMDAIARLLGHLRRLLIEIASNPQMPVPRIPMLGPDEHRALLVDHNDTTRDFGPPTPVHRLFEAQVRRTPALVAAALAATAPAAAAAAVGTISGAAEAQTAVSYASLNGWANAICDRLTHASLGRGAIVPIWIAESPAFVASVLGVLKAGAAFCPLDPLAPDERLSALLAEIACPLILTETPTQARARALGVTPIAVDADAFAGAPPSLDASDCPVTADDPIYAIYTSGSTGTPKAVVVPHRGIYHRLHWMNETFSAGAAAAVLQTTRNIFDSAVWQILWPLINGGKTISIATEQLLDAAAIVDTIARHAITMVDFVPSVFNALVPDIETHAHARDHLASLRVVIVGGEAITPQTTHAFRRAFPAVRVFNLYGPTEASIGCISHEVSDADGARIPIGRPIANTRAFVLDEDGQPMPHGIAGELCLAGECLAIGYLHDEERTHAAFVERELPLRGRVRMYRTGDLVRLRPSGEIDFIGRLDQQIKIRGLRVEPREIEAALEARPDIARALVIATDDEGSEKRLIAYVQPDADADADAFDEAALRQHLRKWLPGALIPSAIVVVQSFPIAPSGKIDRRALPPHAPRQDGAAAAARDTAPLSPLEDVIATAWSAVLGVHPIARADDFFALGGHSLRATQVIARLRDVFGMDLPIRLVFDAPTLGELAARIGELQQQHTGLTIPPLVSQPRSAASRLPLSFAQQRLWFLDRLEPDNAAYNMPHAIRLEGALDRAALDRALQALLARHEALRTWFSEVDGKPAQIIEPEVHARIPAIDLRLLDEESRWSALMRLASTEARLPFHLDHAPLLRVTLVQLDARDHALLITLHHILSDGWSMGVLVRDLCALYAAEAAASTSTPASGAASVSRSAATPGSAPAPALALAVDSGALLPELAVQYADFTLWQQRWLTGDVLAAQVEYWRRTLGSSPPPLELPLDYSRPARQTYRGAGYRFVLPPDVREGLLALARKHGATLFMALLAAWEVLLSRYAGQEDFCIGSPIANRHARGTEDLIGFFVNMLVLRADVSGDPMFVEQLRRVRQRCLDAYAHQDLPFEKLVEELQPARDAARNPLFQVIFALQNTPVARPGLRDLAVSPLPVPIQSTRFDLELHGSDDGEQIDCLLVYNADLFAPETIRQMASSFRTCIESALRDPTRSVSQLSLLSKSEERVAVSALRGRGEAALSPRDSWQQRPAHIGAPTLHDAFARVAASRANAIAIRFGDRQLTYVELDQRSNEIARALIDLGVRPETRVGLYFERSADLIVALLAILKAGGAYVPLDPEYPDERLAFMMSDAQIALVLTADGVCRCAPPESCVLSLDSMRARARERALDAAPAAPPLTRGHAAYVIYTSGSTGRPKGTVVTHGNVLRLFEQTHAWYRFDETDVWMLFHSFAFDVSVWEIWGALLHGGSLVVFPAALARSPKAFHALLEQHGATVLNQTPSAFYQLLHTIEEQDFAPLPRLRLVIFAGEALDPARLQSWFARYSGNGAAPVNMYGITETTVHVTYAPVTRVDVTRARSPIGRPIPDLDLFLLDRHQQPVAPGMLGEIYVGGPGLARGYLNRADLTAERFIPNPFADRPGERLYRSGDLARLHPDGALEFKGRADHQVKIRGYRVELQEIETHVRAHAMVQDAAVIARAREHASTEILAYIVPRAIRAEESATTDALVTQEWNTVFDLTYRREAGTFEPTLNLAGWKDSYAGEPIPAAEMQEWVDATVRKIAALRPRRVLEIGCGTGLLLHRLAPACVSYVGTDSSTEVLDQLRAHVVGLPQVRLVHKPAHDLDGFEPGSFDTIILNSVVQYFPSADYLLRVLDGLRPLLAPGGTIFIGDVRNLDLAEMLHTSRVMARAGGNLSREALEREVREAVAAEEELLIAPAFFTHAAMRLQAAHVDVSIKRGRAHNELTRYRYDVALQLAPAMPAARVDTEWDWRRDALTANVNSQRDGTPEAAAHVDARSEWTRAAFDREALLRRLQQVTAVRIRNVPNARLRDAADSGFDGDAVDPEEICALAEQLGFQAAIAFAGDAAAIDCVDIVLARGVEPVRVGPQAGAGGLADVNLLTNHPRQAWAARRLIPAIRAHLRGRVPEYMVPSHFVLLDALPLTTNGKLDRRKLPEPDARRAIDAGFVAPSTPAEQVVARVWSELLGLDRVGLNDRFLDVGGHSLIAVQVVSRLTAVFQTEVPLQFILDNPSVSAVVERLAELWNGRDVVEEIARTLLEIESADQPHAGVSAA
jgi:amino acid adenylation domain-containing protein